MSTETSCHFGHLLQVSKTSLCQRLLINPFSFNSLGLSAPEEACSRNVRASRTLKFGCEGIFKI